MDEQNLNTELLYYADGDSRQIDLQVKPLGGVTHNQLVKRAKEWLTGTAKCTIAITELSTVNSERPDAIGFGYRGSSILCEVKISRDDFFKDKKKVSDARKIEEWVTCDIITSR